MIGLKQEVKKAFGSVGLFPLVQRVYQSVTPQGRMWRRKIEEHAEKMRNLYKQFIKPGDLCFDVGANYGYRTAVFRELGARVVAVEPQGVAMENLRLRYMHDPKVFLVYAGLDEQVGEREFFIGDQHVISTMSSEWISKAKQRADYANHQWRRSVRVPVTTLDALIAQYGVPSFVKIDVEGFEYQVVKGLSHALPALSLEYNAEFPEPVLQSIERLSTLGVYEFNYSPGESLRFVHEQWMSKADFLQVFEAITTGSVSGDVYARYRGTATRR